MNSILFEIKLMIYFEMCNENIATTNVMKTFQNSAEVKLLNFLIKSAKGLLIRNFNLFYLDLISHDFI